MSKHKLSLHPGIVLLALLCIGAEAKSQATDVDCLRCVDSRDIAAGAVTNGKLAKRVVTTDKIRNGAVTVKKVSSTLSNSIGTSCPEGHTVVGMDKNGNFVCQDTSGGSQGAGPMPLIGVAQIADVKGDSEVIGYEDYFDVRGLAFSIVQPSPPQGGGGAGGAPQLEELRLTINDQTAIPKLNLAAAQGATLQDVKIYLFTDISSPDTSTIELELNLVNAAITSIIYQPPTDDGDLSLVDLTLLPASLSLTNAIFETMMLDRSDPVNNSGCKFPGDALSFVQDVNASPAAVGTPVDNYSFSLSSDSDPVGGGGGGAGKVSFNAVAISAGLIAETTCLFGHVANGAQLSKVEIESYMSPVQSGPSSKTTLESVLVNSAVLETDFEGRAHLTSSFVYGLIEWEAREFDENGNQVGGPVVEIWNVETNAPGFQ